MYSVTETSPRTYNYLASALLILLAASLIPVRRFRKGPSSKKGEVTHG
jgi:hypothetical protein